LLRHRFQPNPHSTGAIAIAANGVPIFNALNNRGEDALLLGSSMNGGTLRASNDYHYHVAPLHLQAIVGATNPIAYALDGLPIYGNTEPDGSPMQALDEFEQGITTPAATTTTMVLLPTRISTGGCGAQWLYVTTKWSRSRTSIQYARPNNRCQGQ
jgi:hypothetical protein